MSLLSARPNESASPERLATITALAPGRPVVPDGCLRLESCAGTWLFDEALGLFFSPSLDARAEVSWRRYERLVTDVDSDAFLVFLNPSGTRLLRAWRHRAPCPRCSEDTGPQRSASGHGRVAHD